MRVEIEYCVPCGYLPRAMEAQQRILEEFGLRVESVALKTGSKGVFTFRADGEIIYTKPDLYHLDAIVREIASRLPAQAPIYTDHLDSEGRQLLMGKEPGQH